MFPIRDSIPCRRTPFVNWLLIGVNVAAFVYESSMGPERLQAFVYDWGVVPDSFHPRQGLGVFSPSNYPPFIASLFLHGSLLHLAGNMLFLWIFGDNVEDKLGHARYLIFYLLCGVLASLTQVAASLNSARVWTSERLILSGPLD